jgi:hypothetical protein
MLEKDNELRLLDCRSKTEVLKTGIIKGSFGLYSDSSIA